MVEIFAGTPFEHLVDYQSHSECFWGAKRAFPKLFLLWNLSPLLKLQAEKFLGMVQRPS